MKGFTDEVVGDVRTVSNLSLLGMAETPVGLRDAILRIIPLFDNPI